MTRRTDSISPMDVAGSAIAVVGLSCRAPGADDPEELLANSLNGTRSIRNLTEQELQEAGVPDEVRSQRDYIRARGTIDGLKYFDWQFFKYTQPEACLIDPQFRLLLELTWRALENAGHMPEPSQRVGAFVTTSSNYGWLKFISECSGTDVFHHTFSANREFFAMLLSYRLGLTGPSINVNTTCSSSLVAVHQAILALRNGDCDVAVAGGAAVSFPLNCGYLYRKGGIMSGDGFCRPFESRADGTVRGDGGGIVVLKPLRSALKARDHIYAVIRGSAVNNDGSQKIGFTAPGVVGQSRVIASALADAAINSRQVTYIETHGTGTALGDAVEMEALKANYGGSALLPCRLAAVKANIGHLDAAAGVVGLIRTILCLQHRVRPGMCGFETAHPQLKIEGSRFDLRPNSASWEADESRFAAVSSFGIGGTNAHQILQEAAPVDGESLAPDYAIWPLSAQNEISLEAMTDSVLELAHRAGLFKTAIGRSLSAGRRHMPVRRAFVVGNPADTWAALRARDSTVVKDGVAPAEGPLSAIFLGTPQVIESCRALLAHEPSFRPIVDQLLSQDKHGSADEFMGALEGQPNHPTDQVVIYATVAICAWFCAVSPKIEYASCGLGRLADLVVRKQSSLADVCAFVGDYRETLSGVLGRDAMRVLGMEHQAGQLKLYSFTHEGDLVAEVLAERNVVDRLAAALKPLFASIYRSDPERNHFSPDSQISAALSHLLMLDNVRRLSTSRHASPILCFEGRLGGQLASSGREIASCDGTGIVRHKAIISALAAAWTKGAALDWPFLYSTHSATKYPVSGYCFRRQLCWPTRPAKSAPDRETPAESAVLEIGVPVWLRRALPPEPRHTEPTIDLWFAPKKNVPRDERRRTTTLVTCGDSFAREQNQTAIRPASFDDYVALCRIIVFGETPITIVHQWSQLIESGTDIHNLASAAAHGLGSLVLLMKALHEVHPGRACRIAVLTSNTHAVRSSEPVNPLRALALGFVRGVGAEFPHIRSALIDIEGERLGSAFHEVHAGLPDTDVAYRGQQRLVLAYSRLRDTPTERLPPLDPQGVYLITGGSGGIGNSLAETLVASGARVALLSRGGKAVHGTSDLIMAGYACDISDRTQLHQTIAAIHEAQGPVRGVFHAAGIAGGQRLTALDVVSIHEGLKAKVLGLLNLLEVLDWEKVEFFTSFSSVTAIKPGPGQIVYAAANAFLDASVATLRSHPGVHATSVNWGTWKDVGMGRRFFDSIAHSSRELRGIPTRSGIDLALALTASPLSNVAVVAADADSALRWHNVAIVRRHSGGPANAISGGDIRGLVKSVCERVVGKSLEPAEDLYTAGLDSVQALDIVDHLQKHLGQIVHVTALSEARTIDQLCAYIERHYSDQRPATASLSPPHATVVAVLQKHKPRIRACASSNDPIVFILSAPRSGSTLLRVILAGNSRLFAPQELGLLGLDALGEATKASTDHGLHPLDGCRNALMHLLGVDADEAAVRLSSLGVETGPALLQALQRLAAPRVLVDKTPSYSLFPEILESMERCFPNARYLHLLRHPNAMIHSYTEAKMDLLLPPEIRDGLSLPSCKIAQANWAISNRNILDFLGTRRADQYLQFWYEDLVSEPDGIVRELCAFLNIPYSAKMIQVYDGRPDRMTDGLRERSRMIGDVKFNSFRTIERARKDAWKAAPQIDALEETTRAVFQQALAVVEPRSHVFQDPA